MSGRCILIGDEITAAGFRLAGVECLVPVGPDGGPPDRPTLTASLEDARARAGLILVTADLAGLLAKETLAPLLAEQRPPVLVIGDIRGRHRPADPTVALKRQLGLSE